MARFDVYANPVRAERRDIPFLVDVQSDFLELLATRMVIPLRRADRFQRTIQYLNPTIEFQGVPVVLDTAAMAAVPKAILRRAVGNARAAHFEIHDALDFLFTGI